MDRIRTIKAIAVIVTASGFIEVLGWFFGVQVLKSVFPWMVTMKFSTAVSFFLSGITLYYIAESLTGRSGVAQAVLPATALLIMLMMATLLASALFGLKSGIEDIFVEEEAGAVKTTVPGRPSLVTMSDFIIISAAAIAALFRGGRLRGILLASGVFIAANAAIALAGYVFGLDHLYYAWPGVSTGMALVTAILFLLLGSALAALSGIIR